MSIAHKIADTIWGPSELIWENPVPVSVSTAQHVANLMNLSFEEMNSKIILDFGCGRGRYLEVFSRFNYKNCLFGLDIDSKSIQEVIIKGFNASIFELSNPIIQFSDESIDIVFSSNVLEHIPPPIYYTVLKEIHRVLKPGGRFVVGIPNYPIKRLYDLFTALSEPGRRRYYFLDDPTHCNKLSCRKLEKALQPYFHEIRLMPSYLFFEDHVKTLKDPKIRAKLRYFGYKISGYACKYSKE